MLYRHPGAGGHFLGPVGGGEREGGGAPHQPAATECPVGVPSKRLSAAWLAVSTLHAFSRQEHDDVRCVRASLLSGHGRDTVRSRGDNAAGDCRVRRGGKAKVCPGSTHPGRTVPAAGRQPVGCIPMHARVGRHTEFHARPMGRAGAAGDGVSGQGESRITTAS